VNPAPTATPLHATDVDLHEPEASDLVSAPHRWTVVVHLASAAAATGPLKVLSVLHARRARITRMEYVTDPCGSGVMTVEFIPGTAGVETVRKFLETAVHVVKATLHAQVNRSSRGEPGASHAES
jgi:hypothetical protein